VSACVQCPHYLPPMVHEIEHAGTRQFADPTHMRGADEGGGWEPDLVLYVSVMT
jgi:hypothetical protein